MAKESDHLAGTLGAENTGGVLTGVLAEENEFDRRALWRIGTWGATAVAAVVVAVMANQSSIGWRRDQFAAVDLSKQAKLLLSIARESQNETRQLAAAIDTLNSDRDRLYSRVTSLEQGLDSVTGAIARQNPTGPLASTVPPSVAPSPAIAPVASAAPAPSASGPPGSDKSRSDIARVEPKAELKAELKSESKPEAKPEPQPKLAAIAESKSESRLEPKTDKAKSEPKVAEAKVEPKTEPKTELKPESKTDLKADLKTESKPEPKIEAKSEAKSETKPDAKRDPKAEAKIDPKADAKPDAKSDLASTPTAPPARTLPRIAPNATPPATLSAPAMAAAALFAPAAGMPEGFPSMIGPPDPAASRPLDPSKPANPFPSSATSPVPAVNAMAAVTPKDRDNDKTDESADANAARLAVQRTEFAVDLGSANSVNGLRALWRGLRFNAALAPLRPVIMIKEGNNGLGMQLRLGAGPLRDAAAAAKICAALVESSRPCETTVFDGQRLAMSAEEAQPPPSLKPASGGKWGAYRHNGSRHAYDNREKEEPPPPAKPPESSSSFSGLFGSKH